MNLQRRWTLIACLMLAVGLSGCIYDARAPYARFANHLDVPVTIEVSGYDELIELDPGRDQFVGEEPGCLGDGLVVTTAEGKELAAFDGSICTDTDVHIWDNEEGLTVSNNDGDFSVPLSIETG